MAEDGKVTTVRFTGRELEELKWLEHQLGLKEAQLVRLSINRFYQYMRAVYDAEWESARLKAAGGGKTLHYEPPRRPGRG